MLKATIVGLYTCVLLAVLPQVAVAQSIEQLYQQGNAAQQAGNYTQAESIWHKVIQLNPNDANAYNNLGIALSDQHKLDQAIEAYKKAILLNPSYPYAYYNLGRVLDTQHKLDQAIEAYKKAILLNPNDFDCYMNLGRTLGTQHKLDQAIEAYKKAILLNPKDAYAYVGLGIALRDQNKLDQAIEAYRKSLQLPEENFGTPASAHTLAHNGLGLVFQQQGKLTQAIEEFRQSIALDKNFVTAQNNLKEAQRLLALRQIPQPQFIDDQSYVPSQTQEPFVRARRSTARIIANVSPEGNSIGAGWVLKREGDTIWIVTNRHVVSDFKSDRPPSKIEVEFYSDLPPERRPRYPATIEKITQPDEEPDLAVLKVTGVHANDIQPLKFKMGWVASTTPVKVIGHPYNVDTPWTVVPGVVINYSQQSPLLPIGNTTVAEGDSGGPVINERQQVIGMMVRIRHKGDVSPTIPPSVNLKNISPATGEVGLAYRIEIIIAKLRSWQILIPTQK